MSPTDRDLLAIAGALAGGVARELSRPLRELRETLAIAVESLDSHVATAKGPTPLPYKQVAALRDKLAEAYLISRTITRLSGDLAAAMAEDEHALAPHEPVPVDLNKLVEAALNLARHRIPLETEVFIDLGALPAVRALPGPMLLAVAQLILIAARSTRGVSGGALSIRTHREADGGGDRVVVSVVDNGQGDPDAAADGLGLVRRIVDGMGGTVDGECERGAGSAFEIHLPVGERG